jgi:A/G-specific adenine glycosylase
MRLGVQAVRRRLLAWFDAHRRDLPWRRTRDPYRILVSEIMLQQTRVQTVVPYYQRFVKQFPTARDLAGAPESGVLRAWAGLGYYARARRLRQAATIIAGQGFPGDLAWVRALPGVGPYTAAAVLSIAFGQPLAAVDGNVRRVLSRLLASPAGQAQADALLDARRPGDFNQALMELGATVCLPHDPDCPRCPLKSFCRARRDGSVLRFPVKESQRPTETVKLRLALVRRGTRVLLEPPTGRGLWPDFWNLPLAARLPLREPRWLTAFGHAVTFRRIQVEVVTGRLHGPPRGFQYQDPGSVALSTPARKALRAAAMVPTATRTGRESRPSR